MDLIEYVRSLITAIIPIFIVIFLIWGTIDNYFLTRYAGKLNRGFTIWRSLMKEEERQFLLNLKEDIVETKRIGLWRTKTSFITAQNGEALIRYSHPFQRTSWPIILYVDLSSAKPEIEYRLSPAMLLSLVALATLNFYLGLFLLIAFGFSWFFETGGARTFLSRNTELHLVRNFSQNREDY